MKKHFAYSLISVLLLSLVVYSCRKEVESPGSPKIDDTNIAKHAEQWLYRNAPMSSKAGDGFVKGRQGVYYKPKWENLQTGNSDRYQVAEFDIAELGQATVLRQETYDRFRECYDSIYLQSPTRYVYMKDKETGEERGFLMTIVPDMEYLEDTNFEPFKDNSYLERDYELNGWVLFYEIDGRFANGWVYKNGRITGTAQVVSGQDMELQMKFGGVQYGDTKSEGGGGGSGSGGGSAGGSCFYIHTIYYTEHCIRIFGHSNCFVVIDETNSIMICDNDSGGGGGNGGGPGGEYNPTPPADAPIAQSLFRNSSISPQDWEDIENMLEEIIKDCMGSGLYSNLLEDFSGGALFLNVDRDASSASFNPNNGVLTLNNMYDDESLFHELFHARQAYEETLPSLDGAQLNLEIESYYTTLLLKRKEDPSYEPVHSIEKAVDNLKNHIDANGQLLSTSTTQKLNEELNRIKDVFKGYDAYEDLNYNSTRSGVDNFKNLNKITKGC